MTKPKTRLVLRHFPYEYTEQQFQQLIAPHKQYIDESNFIQGKQRIPAENSRTGVGYIHVVDASVIPTLISSFTQPITREEPSGNAASKSFSLQVEYAPYQRTQFVGRRDRRDRVEGTIFDDAEYKAFVESLSAPVVPLLSADKQLDARNQEAKEKEKEGVRKSVLHTPIVDFLVGQRDKEVERAKREKEKREQQQQHAKAKAQTHLPTTKGVSPHTRPASATRSSRGASVFDHLSESNAPARAMTRAEERRIEAEKRKQRKMGERQRKLKYQPVQNGPATGSGTTTMADSHTHNAQNNQQQQGEENRSRSSSRGRERRGGRGGRGRSRGRGGSKLTVDQAGDSPIIQILPRPNSASSPSSALVSPATPVSPSDSPSPDSARRGKTERQNWKRRSAGQVQTQQPDNPTASPSGLQKQIRILDEHPDAQRSSAPRGRSSGGRGRGRQRQPRHRENSATGG